MRGNPRPSGNSTNKVSRIVSVGVDGRTVTGTLAPMLPNLGEAQGVKIGSFGNESAKGVRGDGATGQLIDAAWVMVDGKAASWFACWLA